MRYVSQISQTSIFWLGMLASTTFLLTGCGQADSESTTASNADVADAKGADASHDHSGWWCDEHGVPEEACTRCSSRLIAGFKEKGDWCDEHERPDSQCFHCHPELEGKFAARYEAKYGKKPPKPTDP